MTNSNIPVPVSGLTGVTAIAGGYSHSIASKSDGTVWAWGRNNYGQLGDGTLTDSTTPVPVSGLTRVTAIASGNFHSIALKNDGTVWTWGRNNYGQLGDGTLTDRPTRVPVKSGLSYGVRAIAGGDYHSIVLKSDGTVQAWGRNNYGQLGDGTLTDSSTAVQVSGLTEVTAIAAGSRHSIASKSDGTVWAWGYNAYGQLGDGALTDSTTPVQVSGLTGLTAIAGGDFHSIALTDDGDERTVWAWGLNSSGQLGNGTITSSSAPVQVSGLTGVTAIAGGGSHSIALKSDGTVWAWGLNSSGQLGNGAITDSPTPVQVKGPGGVNLLTGVTAIAGGSAHSIALKSDGTVWACGSNNFGQLGNGTTTSSSTPVQVSGLTGVTAIAGGNYHSIALKGDGTVWAWGYNYYGQLGDGTTTIDGEGTTIGINSNIPVMVSGLSGVTAITGGSSHSIALKGDGTVWAWGYNNYGQLGNGTKTFLPNPTPVQVNGPSGVGFLTGVLAIAGGGNHSLALKGDGTVWAWGDNNYGQLSDGTTAINSPTPVPVSGLPE